MGEEEVWGAHRKGKARGGENLVKYKGKIWEGLEKLKASRY